MGLRLKFNLVMISAFVTGLVLAAVLINALSQRLARQAVFSEAATVMAELEATIQYTDTDVSPLLARSMKVQFLPQSIPFFAAQRTFDLLTPERPDYSLRQPADNPTNPNDKPAPWEARIIDAFRADPKLASLTTERTGAAGQVMSFSRPVRITDPACLACHSTPEAAPSSMIDVYGPKNGFGWKLGSLVGAQIVSVPERVALTQAHQSLLLIMGGFTAVFAVMLLVLNVLLQAVIVAPVRRMSANANEVSLGNLDGPEFETGSSDEIGLLAVSFNRMRRSLVAAFRLIGD